MADTDITKITGYAAGGPIPDSVMLRAQLNRYAAFFTPKDLKLFSSDLPLDGPIDNAVAARAGAVLAVRASRSMAGVVVTNEEALLAGKLLGDFSGALTTANAPFIIGLISGYADANGLPRAILPGQVDIMSKPVLIGAGAVVLVIAGVVFWNMRKKSRALVA